MRRPRRALAALTAGVLAAGVLAAPAGASPRVRPAGWQQAPPVVWQPCAAAPHVQCGTVTVPVDWSRPDGATIGIAVARRPATGPDATGRTLVYLPGGPGGSGVNDLTRMPTVPQAWQGFDVVSFDPRGVGRSHPVRCDADLVAEPYPEFPATAAEFDRLVAHNRALGDSCRALTGALFDFLDSASVAHDLDAIRAALGQQQVNLYGISYGTLVAQQYAARYPYRVRTAVLDSVMDHATPGTAAFLTAQARAVQESWDEFTAWCGRTPSCALHGADPDALLGTLYDRAERGELVDGDHGPVSAFTLGALITAQQYAPDRSGLANRLAGWRDAPRTTTRRAPARRAAVDVVAGFGEPVPLATFAVFCQDWSLPVRDVAELDALRLRMRAVAPDMRFSPLGWLTTTGCLGWPSPVRNPQRPRWSWRSASMLIVNSRYDPATPWQWAETTARVTGARLLRYDGWGHRVVARDVPCVTAHLRRYLTTGRTPAPGARCAAPDLTT